MPRTPGTSRTRPAAPPGSPPPPHLHVQVQIHLPGGGGAPQDPPNLPPTALTPLQTPTQTSGPPRTPRTQFPGGLEHPPGHPRAPQGSPWGPPVPPNPIGPQGGWAIGPGYREATGEAEL